MLHSSESSAIKRIKRLKSRQKPTPVGCKQACEDTIFTSTAHEGKHESLQTVQTVQHVSAQKVPLNLHLKSSLYVWIKESLPCCQVQKNLPHKPQHVTVADRKKMNKLEKRNK